MAQQPISNKSHAAQGLTQGEAIAIAVGVAWMVIVGVFFWMLPPVDAAGGAQETLVRIMMVIAIFMPVALMWVAGAAARSARMLRADAYHIQAAIDGLRQTVVDQQAQQVQQAQLAKLDRAADAVPAAAPAPAPAPAPDVPPQPETAGTKEAEPTVSRFASRREVSRLITPRAAPQMPADQPALELGTIPEDKGPPLERRDLIQALNFPDDEHDTEGFAALRRALRDRSARRLVQASQDVLTLLSQDGIYTDDLHPDPVPPDYWRRFAAGERGKDVDRLGAVRDRDALALTAARMREDAIFRDAVHHFLRRFDEMLVTFAEHATDADLLRLAETRTARAFMVLARSAGTFD